MKTHKTALLIIDTQPDFITEENNWVVSNVQKLLQKTPYDAYIEAVFSAPPGSLWDKQTNWTFPKQDTLPEIKSLIPKK